MPRLALLFFTLVCVSAGCSDEIKYVAATQITARIRVDQLVGAQMANLRVRSYAERDGEWQPGVEHTYPKDVVGALMDVAFVPREGTPQSRVIEVVVEALDDLESPLVQQRALVRFAPREQHVLDITLAACGTLPLRTLCEPNAECRGPFCQTCVNQACGTTRLFEGSELPLLDPTQTPGDLDASMDPATADGGLDAGPVPSVDSGADSAPPVVVVTCATPDAGITCDDGNACNGRELCDPTNPTAGPNGCALVVPKPADCAANQTCDKTSGMCTSCEMQPDGDGDMANSTKCGGLDCDDEDAARAPGRAEICDGKDNDCSGVADDGPGPNAACATMAPTGGTSTCELGKCVQRCTDPDADLTGGACVKRNDCAGVTACGVGGTCVDGVRTFTCTCGPGSMLAADMKSCVRAPGWSVASGLESQAGTASRPRIAMNRAGVAMVVWRQVEGTGPGSLWSRRFASGSWASPALAGSNVQGAGDVAVDGLGNAYAVWSQPPSGALIWANRHVSGSWGTASFIDRMEYAPDNTFSVQVVASEGAGALATWCHNVGSGVPSPARVWGSALSADAPLPVATDLSVYGPNVDAPDVALDDQGRATVVWMNGAGTNQTLERGIFARRSVGGVWGTQQRIDPAGGVSESTPTPSVAVDGSGNVLAVWTSGGVYWTRAAISGFAWSAAAKLAGTDTAQDTTSALWSNGDGLVLWTAPVTGGSGLHSASFSPARGLETIRRIDRAGTFATGSAQLAVGPAGVAMVVWQQADGVWASRFVAATGWGDPVKLGTGTTPDVAMDGTGAAIAVWQDAGEVMFSRYE